MRIRAIDNFRGLTIVLMVFFTMLLVLSNSLPWLLTHNVSGGLRPGDFVLPMFLFASGMSLVYFEKKRGKTKGYLLDIIERVGKLAILWFFLSPFSAGEFLGMDEIMLNLLLFVPTILLIRFSDKEIVLAGLVIFMLYLILHATDSLPDLTTHYLGGYGGAIFYLPVMLAGVVAGRNIHEIKKYILPSLLLSMLMLLTIPPFKLAVTPSFMALSISLALIVFELCKKITFEQLEYLGRTPIRYWVLMFVLLGAPLVFYASSTKTSLPLEFDWPVAILIAVCEMVLLYLVSKLIDWFLVFVKKIEIVRG
ncbi:Uncharacterised protein [Candidatus Bilamarchaeum dharawalense]|uniref:Heparan-alpha-glucosaminide N-acetyltransferase catalytic domain-containing protein n=1 Tax=Candidatus Bilamarchaeum dharawalense TaxID=2885759 RepID=A0A5E4LS92_9ARCH|nr:Uncharacterised protein [Candidatus Bilamarchaeum dharawalense]